MEIKTLIRVIGIGNPMAGDDAVGNHVVRKLIEQPMPGIEVIDAGPVGLSLLDLLEGAEKVVIVDAFHSGREEGEILRLAIPRDLEKISSLAWGSANPSTHLIGLGEALTIGHVLGILPPYLVIYGVELGQIGTGTGLSVNISHAVENVANRIVHELEQWACTNFK